MTALKCPICGAPVPPGRTRPRKYCSKKCADRGYNLLPSARDALARKHEARARLAKRDEEYAKVAARVTVDCVRTTDGRTLVVETRGRCCIGWRSSGHVSHS